MADVILKVEHLSKSFGPNAVLKDIDFTVSQGDVTCIIGASGSGKSTTSPLDSTSSSESRNLLFRIASAIGPLQVSLLLTKISLSYFFISYTSIT